MSSDLMCSRFRPHVGRRDGRGPKGQNSRRNGLSDGVAGAGAERGLSGAHLLAGRSQQPLKALENGLAGSDPTRSPNRFLVLGATGLAHLCARAARPPFSGGLAGIRVERAESGHPDAAPRLRSLIKRCSLTSRLGQRSAGAATGAKPAKTVYFGWSVATMQMRRRN